MVPKQEGTINLATEGIGIYLLMLGKCFHHERKANLEMKAV